MQYNDTTNNTGTIQRCEMHTGLGLGRISGNTNLLQIFTQLNNETYQEVLLDILRSQDEWAFDDSNNTTYPILTAGTVANQSAYTLPDSTLKIQRVEITYDGTNWKKAEPFDINESGEATDSTSIDNNFTTASPYYDVFSKSIRFYPTPETTRASAIKIWILREVNVFTSSDTTKEPGFDEPFHQMIPLGASLKYASDRSMSNASKLQDAYNDMRERLINYYGKKQEDRVMVLKQAYIDYE